MCMYVCFVFYGPCCLSQIKWMNEWLLRLHVLLLIRESSIVVRGSYMHVDLLARRGGTSEVQLVSMVYNCLHHKAPRYLTDYCITISDVASRRHLHSARRHYLVVPRHSLSSYGPRAFVVAGQTAWNSLSDDLSDLTLSTDSFRRLLKTWLFSEY